MYTLIISRLASQSCKSAIRQTAVWFDGRYITMLHSPWSTPTLAFTYPVFLWEKLLACVVCAFLFFFLKIWYCSWTHKNCDILFVPILQHDPCLLRGREHMPLGWSGSSEREELKRPKTNRQCGAASGDASQSKPDSGVCCALTLWCMLLLALSLSGISYWCQKLWLCKLDVAT